MLRNLLLAVILIILVLVLLTYLKTNLLYQPHATTADKYSRFITKLQLLAETKEHLTNVLVTTQDNHRLDTVFVRNPDAPKLIIFFHGNAGNITMRFDMLKFLYNYASVLVFDYRTFGLSTGTSSGLSADKLQVDADAIWNYAVHHLGFSPESITLFGESLGCAVAVQLAYRLNQQSSPVYPRALVLNSPFSSLRSMIVRTFDRINIGPFGKLVAAVYGREYDTSTYIRSLHPSTTILIAHSPRDEIVPYREGYALYSIAVTAHSNTKFVPISGTHNNLRLTDTYIYALADLHAD